MNKLTIQDWGKIIGCRVKDVFGSNCGELKYPYEQGGFLYLMFEEKSVSAENCKPTLRTFYQMTEKEHEELCVHLSTSDMEVCEAEIHIEDGHLSFYINGEGCMAGSLQDFEFLESMFFDVRGWIEAGLAIKEGDNE